MAVSKRLCTCAQSRLRNWMSAASSSSPLPSATVLTMKPPVAGRSRLDDAAQPLALRLVVDAPGHADVARLGHVDDVAPGNGDEGGDAGALEPERLLGDLDQDLLPLRSISSMGACTRATRAVRLALAEVHVGGVVLLARRPWVVFLAEIGGVVPA